MAWICDIAAELEATKFVFAYTNRGVDAVNAELRQVRRDRGEFAESDVRFDTKDGPADFAPGNRVQFTDTDKRMRLYNTEAGVIRARLDAVAGQQGREVAWSAPEFTRFRYSHTGTIYKGQGKTLDHTFLYHTHHWRVATSYVALTQQRESAQVFVARETARDTAQLAQQIAREEIKSASVAGRTAAAVAPSLERIAAAEAKAAQGDRESVKAQRRADTVPIPKLTAQAEAAVAALTQAADDKARAELWTGITADKTIGAELRRFSDAVQCRFGEETVRAMLRAEGRSVEARPIVQEYIIGSALVQIRHPLSMPTHLARWAGHASSA